MLIAGLGVGALASQLGSVTVSSVPDERSSEVGGLQNTITNLGISIGTALTGAILIAALSSSFLTGVQENDAVPASVKSKASTELSGGVPFISDAELESALDKAHVPPRASDAIVEENETARLVGPAHGACRARAAGAAGGAAQLAHTDRAARGGGAGTAGRRARAGDLRGVGDRGARRRPGRAEKLGCAHGPRAGRAHASTGERQARC